jgi:thiamine-phosphate diphosphorylase
VPPARICLVTPDSGRQQELLHLIAAASRAGVDIIQVRERRMGDRALLDLTRRAVAVTGPTPSRLVVNDRLDVAVAAGAAGVHLRADSFSARRVRTVAATPFLVGRSVHDQSEAEAAVRAGGCDYLVFGTVFRSASKPANQVPAGLDALERVCRAVPLPVLAIGGITLDNVRDVAAAGAAGVAGISIYLGGIGGDGIGGDGLAATVAELRRAFDR